MENENIAKPIKETLGSVGSFSTTVYLITLIFSISYNIGYLKQINPQIIDLLEIGDYVDTTIHNIWFFLLGSLLFFCGSLALAKNRIREGLGKIVIIGLFTFILSGYYLLKGIYYSKYWPTINQLINENKIYLLFMVIIAIALCFLFVSLGKALFKVISDSEGEKDTLISTSILPVLMFLILVLTPYICGITQGYIENKYFTQLNYDPYSSVNLNLTGNKELNGVFILKKLSKGLVIRKFEANKPDTIMFVNWGTIQGIKYTKIKKLVTPI